MPGGQQRAGGRDGVLGAGRHRQHREQHEQERGDRPDARRPRDHPCSVFITSALPVSSAGRPAKMISPRSMA